MITVTRREPPSDDADWLAPYEVRCAEHGWLCCRRNSRAASRAGQEHVEHEHGEG